MALSKIGTNSLEDLSVTSGKVANDNIGPTQLNEAANYDFTGTVTGAGGITEFSSYFSNNSQSISSNTTWTTLSSLTYDTSVVIGTGMTLILVFGLFLLLDYIN